MWQHPYDSIANASYQSDLFGGEADYHIPMDGNCFWKALSVPLQRHWRVIKRASIRHLVHRYRGKLPLNHLNAATSQLPDGTWCSTLTVCAAALQHQVRIHVHIEEEGRSYYIGNHTTECLEIAVRLQQGHYSLVQWGQGMALREIGAPPQCWNYVATPQVYSLQSPMTSTTSFLCGGGGQKGRTPSPASTCPRPTSGADNEPTDHGAREHDLVPVQLTDPSDQDLEITVLRQHYPWHRALRQGTFGWRVRLRPGTAITQIQKVLARQLKIRQSYLTFTSDGQPLASDYLVQEPVALTLKIDRTVDGHYTSTPGKHCPTSTSTTTTTPQSTSRAPTTSIGATY